MEFHKIVIHLFLSNLNLLPQIRVMENGNSQNFAKVTFSENASLDLITGLIQKAMNWRNIENKYVRIFTIKGVEIMDG